MNLNKSEPFKYYISNWSFQLQGSQVAGEGGEREQSIFNLNPPPPQMLLTLRQGQVNPKGRK